MSDITVEVTVVRNTRGGMDANVTVSAEARSRRQARRLQAECDALALRWHERLGDIVEQDIRRTFFEEQG